MLHNLGEAFSLLATVQLVVVVLLSAVYGMFIGAIPGLTATLATALLVPIALFLDPIPAVASIISMSAMAIFAGDIPSALVRMPGTPASAAYTDDAYLLTQNGQGARVLGVGLVGSAIGGIAGAIVLIFAAPALSRVAMQFTSFEYFWVAVLGLTAAVIISRGSQLKGAISLMLGLLVSMIGLDQTSGAPRFTFGNGDLLGGISFIPAMIGLFGLSEVIRNVINPARRVKAPRMKTKGMLGDTFRTLRKYWKGMVSGNAIGAGIGALPGAGGDVAAWVAYAATKNASPNGKLFGRGKGHIEPIVSAGAANNAAVASAYVPTLVFGIPGDTITAILMGVLLIQDIEPGPGLFAENAPTLYAMYMLFIIANLLMIPLGFLAIKASGNLLRVPAAVLMPIIVAFCIVGAYSINNARFEIIIVLVFGVIGYFMERHGYPVAPAVLGIVLGPIIERNFMSSVIKTNWDFSQFFTRPISAILLSLTILVLLYPMLAKLFRRKPRDPAPADDET